VPAVRYRAHDVACVVDDGWSAPAVDVPKNHVGDRRAPARHIAFRAHVLAFARADLLPPLLAAWTANIVFFGIGTSLFVRART
jgi:hypothetical protein